MIVLSSAVQISNMRSNVTKLNVSSLFDNTIEIPDPVAGEDGEIPFEKKSF